LQSSFYRFFVFTGMLTSSLVLLSRRANIEYSILSISYTWCLILVYSFLYGSHSFSLTHTVGKVSFFLKIFKLILVAATRFTAICYPVTLRDFWSRKRVNVGAVLMFAVPALLCIYIIPAESIYRLIRFPNFCILNFENKYLQLMKLISSVGYFLFFVISTPMCAACLYRIRQAQKFNKDLVRQERALLLYTILTTTAHMVKSAQQVSSYINRRYYSKKILDLLYPIGNTLSTFLPPLLLILTSRHARHEV
ncbi:hypothetical protein PFISCL1PPCAC_3313, partial [Pristionchus fissidentatus]